MGADGRDFAGSYQLTDTVEQGDTVSATFTTRVFNYSDADISAATLVLDSRLPPGRTYWSFPSVSIVNRGSVRLRCLITIPRAEYNNWQQGARPNLHVDTANPDGTSLRRMVELSRNLVGEEQNNIRTGISSPVPAGAVTAPASAQPSTISTYAGGGPINGPALSINVARPQAVAATASGDVYFASSTAVYRLAGDIAILIAGTPGVVGLSNDNGPATSASLNPSGVAVDGSGNLYIADGGSNLIRKVAADTGVITTVAGNGSSGFSGDGGLATSASLNPSDVAVDGNGNLYIADGANNRIRKVSTQTGVITTVAGNGSPGFTGDGGPATSASLDDPLGVAVDGSGNIYIADYLNSTIRKVWADTGMITTVAGAGPGTADFIGDGGPATSAGLNGPTEVAVDGSGNLYIADTYHVRIRKVSADTGVITTVAGNGSFGSSGDAGPASSASLYLPQAVAVDGSENLYIADTGNNRIRKVSAETSVISTVAGNGSVGFSGDGGPATSASLYPVGVAMDRSGDLYIADGLTYRIRKVSAETGVVSTVAGNGSSGFSGDGGPATSASLYSPSRVAVDGSGNLYIVESNYCGRGGCSGSNRIRKVSAETGVITTVAGNGSLGFSGDGGPATSASLLFPSDVAVDGSGNLYIADSGNHRIRKVSAETGVITTVAGNGSGGFSGDGGPATSASLYTPASGSLAGGSGVAVDGTGNFYIVDINRIRKVSATTGVITTVAGNGGYDFSGDGGPATSASLKNPLAVAVDNGGNLYIADTFNYRIRKVSSDTGVISTVAGNGNYGLTGDNGPAASASLTYVTDVAVDASGNFYIADSNNQRVRKVDHRISATTLLTCNANPTTTENLVITAAISPGDATGSVQFFDGFTALRSVALSAGTATLSDPLLTVGTHSLVAVYSGDTNYAMSTSASLVQAVSSRAFSTMTLTSDGQPTQSNGQTVYVSTLNSPATFTATLAPVTASGTVQFFDGATGLGMQTISGGSAVFTTSSLPAGNHTITAVFSGDAFFLPSWAPPLTQQVWNVASGTSVNNGLSPR